MRENMDEPATTFQGFAYRTSSRFGDCVRLSLAGEMVTVTGPRIGAATYRLWIVTQAVLLALVLPALVIGLALWDWRFLVLAPALVIVHWAVGGLGAAVLWSAANGTACTTGRFPSVSFPLSAVKRVKIGRGWARKGLWLVIPYFVPLVNRMAEGHAVSFEAPGGGDSGDVVYCLHLPLQEEARALAAALEVASSSPRSV
jgi:hypothetical protein